MTVLSAVAAVDELLAAYDAIAAAQYRKVAVGQPLVGIVGGAVPREIVHGFGASPVHIAGLEDTRTLIAEFMEEFAPWHWQGIGEGMLQGSYSDFAALVLDRSHQHFYYYLKEMQRLGAGRGFPRVLLLDWIQASDKDHSAYNEAQAIAFASSLERATGQTYAPERTAMAAREYNGLRDTLRDFQSFRTKSALSGSVAYRLMAVSQVMQAARYRELLTAVMRGSEGAGGDVPRVLLVSSQSMMSLRLHQAVEAAGCVVVAEDDWWGTRCAHDDAPVSGSISRLCAFYASLGIGEFAAPMTKRCEWYRNPANFHDVDFAVLHHSDNDEHAGWDYPLILEELARIGIPGLCIGGNCDAIAGSEQVRDAVAKHAGRAF